MLPGPIQIVACPHCGGLASYGTLLSGNTFGARTWTDGKQIAPMLPRPPAVVKCGVCKKFYWLQDAIEVGSWDRWGGSDDPVDPAWENAQDVEEPSVDEYYAAIREKLAKDAEEERSLRVLAWWRGNDRFRKKTKTRAIGERSTKAFRANLQALAGLLDEANENDLIMKAEVLRELGEFEAATEVLNRIGSPDYSAVVQQLRTLCDQKDSTVTELRFGP